MKQISVQQLDSDKFSKYGRCINTKNTNYFYFDGGYYKFYRDIIQQKLVRETTVSYSLTYIEPRSTVLDSLEFHDYTEEMIYPLDGDLLMCVAPATGGTNVPTDEVECFLIPQNTFVLVRQGTWHGMPFATGDTPVNLLCMLPERTYMKDCYVSPMSGEDRIEILWP